MAKRGFTFTEFMLAALILIILGAIGITAFYNSRTAKGLDAITDGLVFTLNKARSESINGNSLSQYGVLIASTSYTYFKGSGYDPAGADNKINDLPSGWNLSTTTSNGSSEVVFSRLTGTAQADATIKVMNLANTSLKRDIVVDTQGGITVVRY